MHKKIEHFEHYYKISQERSDLKVFKDLLQVHSSQPHVDISKFVITTHEHVRNDKNEIVELKFVDKTFHELVEDLKPKTGGSGV